MSGTVRVRRQWQIQDGPRGTLRRLRSQMAEDGCVESQVVVAKQLLEESRNGKGESSWSESTAQAVQYLMKASEQGNSEAIALLNSCFKSGTGITEENYDEVKMRLNMSADEGAFRTAARQLFVALTPFGQEFVTTHQLTERISTKRDGDDVDLSNGSCCDAVDGDETWDASFTKWYQNKEMFEGEHLSGDKLVDIAGQVAQGHLPSVLLTDSNETDLKRCNRQRMCFQSVVSYVLRGLLSVSTKTLDVVAEHGDVFLSNLLPLAQLRTIGIIMLFGFVPPSAILYLLPVFGFYVSLAVMVVSNLQMLCNVRRHLHFMSWLRVFQVADVTLDVGNAERRFCHRQLQPYVRFFVAFFVTVCCRPFCASESICFSDLMVVSVGFALVSVVTLNPAFTLHVWLFLMMTALETVVRFCGRDALNFLSLTFGFKTIEKEFGGLVVVNFGIGLIPVTFLIVVILWMAVHKQFHGFCCILLPNLVSLSWMHLARLFFPEATWLSLARSSVLMTAVIALPLTVLILVPVLLVVGLLKLGFVIWESTYFVAIATAAVVILVTSLVKWVVDRRSTLPPGRWKRFLLGVQVLCGLLALLQFVPALRDISLGVSCKTDHDSQVFPLIWNTYRDLCYSPLDRLSHVEIQENCALFSDVTVHWKGHVKTIRISRIYNKMEDTLGYLPASVAAGLRCVYGISYDDCDHDSQAVGTHRSRTCAIVRSVTRRKCHLQNWNVYEFEVKLNIKSDGYWNSGEVFLSADDSFKNFMFRLLPNDQVDFRGVIGTDRSDGLLSRPVIKLSEIHCDDCAHHMDAVSKVPTIDVREQWDKFFSFIFDFMFSPYVELKSTASI